MFGDVSDFLPLLLVALANALVVLLVVRWLSGWLRRRHERLSALEEENKSLREELENRSRVR